MSFHFIQFVFSILKHTLRLLNTVAFYQTLRYNKIDIRLQQNKIWKYTAYT
jgi:hypothetical protein